MSSLKYVSLLLGIVALNLDFARAESLTVATYNIENYGPADRMTDAGFRKDYPKPEGEKRALRAVIRALNADILVLQEMGGQPYLDELRRDLKSEGLDYPHAALATAAESRGGWASLVMAGGAERAVVEQPQLKRNGGRGDGRALRGW